MTQRSDDVQPLVRPFDQAPAYQQDEPGDARFNWLIQKNEIPGLCVGRVRLRGPIHKTPAAHDTFHQAYLVIAGQGTIHVGQASYTIDGPTVIVIPKNTRHSVQLQAGQSIEYAFINQYH